MNDTQPKNIVNERERATMHPRDELPPELQEAIRRIARAEFEALERERAVKERRRLANAIESIEREHPTLRTVKTK